MDQIAKARKYDIAKENIRQSQAVSTFQTRTQWAAAVHAPFFTLHFSPAFLNVR
jgi:hypothetical protein